MKPLIILLCFLGAVAIAEPTNSTSRIVRPPSPYAFSPEWLAATNKVAVLRAKSLELYKQRRQVEEKIGLKKLAGQPFAAETAELDTIRTKSARLSKESATAKLQEIEIRERIDKAKKRQP